MKSFSSFIEEARSKDQQIAGQVAILQKKYYDEYNRLKEVPPPSKRKKKKVEEEFKQMPGKLMNRQMLKLQQSQSDLRKGRQTKKKRDREIKYDIQMKSIQMAGKQDYNKKGESYGQFWQDPLKTGKIRNPRFR